MCYHEELSYLNRIKWCVSAVDNGTCRQDADPHGALVLGVIAAALNDRRTAGAAPLADIYVIRVFYSDGRPPSSGSNALADAIRIALKGPDGRTGTDDDADVISISLSVIGPGAPFPWLHEAVKEAYNNGSIIVASAGNDGASSPSYPAAYPEVIAVGAIDINYNVPSWSNRNPNVVAPGVSVPTIFVDHPAVWNACVVNVTLGVAYCDGTSFAAPQVSGIVAIIQSLRLSAGLRKLTPWEVIRVINVTAIDLGDGGYDPAYGNGLVNAQKAVACALRWERRGC